MKEGAYLIIFKIERRYKSSTRVLAQGVLRKNFKLDFTDGLSVKHFIFMRLPKSSKPCFSTKASTIVASLMPCKGSLDFMFC